MCVFLASLTCQDPKPVSPHLSLPLSVSPTPPVHTSYISALRLQRWVFLPKVVFPVLFPDYSLPSHITALNHPYKEWGHVVYPQYMLTQKLTSPFDLTFSFFLIIFRKAASFKPKKESSMCSFTLSLICYF